MNGRARLALLAIAAGVGAALASGASKGAEPAPSREARRLTTHPAEDRSPAWSPDGSRLLFASERDGNWEIYSLRPDGSGLERVTRHPGADQSPAWAPSGDRFVYQRSRPGPVDDGQTEPAAEDGLWIFELADGESRQLVADSSPELLPDWSPDGRWIAFTSRRDGNAELYRVAVEGGEAERLTQEPLRDAWPRYFPDGESLVFFSRRATSGRFDDLFRLDLTSRAVERITEHPDHHDFVPDVSPDGRRIVAGMSDREAGRRELVVLDLSGRVLHRLAGGYHRVFHPAWSPDGRWIAYAARVADGDSADLFVVRAPD